MDGSFFLFLFLLFGRKVKGNALEPVTDRFLIIPSTNRFLINLSIGTQRPTSPPLLCPPLPLRLNE